MSSVSDILVHLRPCKITVTFAGVDYMLPALDAADWVALVDGPHADLYEIFPILAGADAVEAVEDALWNQTATYADVEQVALDAITAAADRPWWEVVNVLRSAATAWDRVHVNQAVGSSLAGWLDELWSHILTHIDPKKRQAWISDMTKAPKQVAKQEIDFDAEEQAFLAAMNAVMR